MIGKKPNRDTTIDTLRGVAIFTMVGADLAASALQQPHPFWVRLYGTFAAPMFILLSGFMVSYTTKRKNYQFKHFLVRGLMLITTAALLDVLVFGNYPFTSVDVLSLIGVSYPLAYIFQRMKTFPQLLLVTGIFSLTPLLQNVLGYTDYPTDIPLFGAESEPVANQTSILNHWFVDGWFPLFPWLGFSFLGVYFAKLRQFYTSFAHSHILIRGGAVFAVGAVIWWFHPGKLLVRDGYSELFYPPTIGYILVAIGLITMLFCLSDYNSSLTIYKPLQTLGQSSLFIYILHYVIITYWIANLLPDSNLAIFLGIYLVLIALLLLVAYGLRSLKLRWRNCPYVIKFLIGG